MKNGNRRLMIVKPPGAGKGTYIAYLLNEIAKKGNRGLFIVHKRDLIVSENGIGDRLEKQFNFRNYGYYLSGMPKAEKPIMLGTVQTMIKRKTAGNFHVIIVDECHRVKMKTYQRLLQRWPNAVLIGFTATPFRGDKKGFRDDFDALIHPVKYNELVAKKALVRTEVIAPALAPDVTGIKTKGGSDGFRDFVDEDLIRLYDNDRVYQGVVDKWKEYASGLKTIVFNVNSKMHSKKTAEYFRSNGINAKAIDSDTPHEERDRLLTDFENDKFEVLCNIGLFTEGISIDDVKCIVFNVATNSPTKWVQAAARGSRPVWDSTHTDWLRNPDGSYFKDHCLILDFGRNAERHGYIDDYDALGFTLDGTPPKLGNLATKTCPECDKVVYVQTRICPQCGYEFPIKPKDDKVYADEAEWRKLERIKILTKNFSQMPYYKIEKAIDSGAVGPEMYRIIAKIQGYHPSWAIYKGIEADVIPNGLNPRLDQKNYAKAMAYLEKIEKHKGTLELYQQMKKRKGA